MSILPHSCSCPYCPGNPVRRRAPGLLSTGLLGLRGFTRTDDSHARLQAALTWIEHNAPNGIALVARAFTETVPADVTPQASAAALLVQALDLFTFETPRQESLEASVAKRDAWQVQVHALLGLPAPAPRPTVSNTEPHSPE